ALADYAQAVFPKAGIPFADVHAAIAFAACGDAAALLRLDENLRMLARDGQFPAGPVVAALAAAWQAFVARDWERVLRCLSPAIAAHERIGGSRAQRDLIEFTWLVAAAEAGHLRDAASPVTRDRVQRVAASMLQRRRAREAV
ncbi:MAG: hypothetical protein ABJB04_08850, partial [Betaproteobacteria bacterium]